MLFRYMRRKFPEPKMLIKGYINNSSCINPDKITEY